MKRLPKMACERCGACCRLVICTADEYERVNSYAAKRGIEPIRQGATCPWFKPGQGCQVYEARPWVCRLYGHVQRMPCPNGHDKRISSGEELRYVDAAMAQCSRKSPRFLHSVNHTKDEISTLFLPENPSP